jgi:hypothetical protein
MAKTSRVSLLMETGWPTLHKRRHIQSLCIFYTIHAGTAPNYLTNILDKYRFNHVYSTRNTNMYRQPNSNSVKFANTFFPKCINMWNSLNNEQRSIKSISMFKCALNPKYQKTVWHYYGQRWGNIHHARLRMGYSKLRCDLFKNYHVVPNENCV